MSRLMNYPITVGMIILALLVMPSLLLTGCSEGTIIYQGKEMPVIEAEERIADALEVENPDLDLEVNIYRETDD